MTPGARIQAVIELLDQIESPPRGKEELPADAVLNAYFRARRYIGAKDRRAIGDAIYQTLRQRGAIDWWLVNQAGLPATNRFRALWAFNAQHGMDAASLIAACDGGRYRPTPLDAEAARRVELFDRRPFEHSPVPADRASFPIWLASEIERRFGAHACEEMLAFTRPAAADLRVNTLKATRAEAAAMLATAGVRALPTPHSPIGLRLENRVNIAMLGAYRNGCVEVQDESSQLAALLVDAKPGMRVLDLCAGAGGKTLALAASMGNRGTVVACDAYFKRLARMAPRLARSGAKIVKSVRLGENGKAFASLGAFDRVLVDAPCSGSGTWRRQPEAKWRLTLDRLANHRTAQALLLSSAAERLRPNGRLVYAVCSILPSEGADQIDAFLAGPGRSFRVASADKVWRAALGTDSPFGGGYMMLSPYRHGTDGFFCAVLERQA